MVDAAAVVSRPRRGASSIDATTPIAALSRTPDELGIAPLAAPCAATATAGTTPAAATRANASDGRAVWDMGLILDRAGRTTTTVSPGDDRIDPMSDATLGVEVRELSSPDELEDLLRIFDDVWRPDPTNRPVGTDMLRALSHAGNYVAGAFIGDHLAGGSVAFFGAPVGETLHSHITGVTRRGRGHQVGYALKMHQRRWALERGLSTITWTFDPLVARNAYFNLAKLGATPVHYYEDFYGELGDELGGDADSDRVLVAWDLKSAAPSVPDGSPRSEGAVESVDEALAGGAVSVIDVDRPSHPVAHHERITPDAGAVVEVPRDVESMRVSAPLDAARWRIALRDALSPLLVEGEARRSVRFLRSGHYVFGPAGSGAR